MRRAQSMSEYAVLIAVFAAALIIGQTYVKKALTGRIKSSGDSISQDPFGKNFEEDSWSVSTSEEKTGLLEENKWTQSELISNEELGSPVMKKVDLGGDIKYQGGLVQASNSFIHYDLRKGQDETIFSE